MKKIIAILIVILGLNSCKDFLVLSPEYQINEINYYQSESDYETAVIGIYNSMQSLHNNILYLTELTTDNGDVTYQSAPNDQMDLDQMTVSPSNSMVNYAWRYCYTIIANSNNILDRINDINMNENKRSQFKGEALFLRAYSYFYLVRLFGEVPIVDVAFRSPDQISNFDMTRKPISEVYSLIEGDLKSSATFLKDVTGMSKGRASSGAAKTLLGKVYLTKAEYVNATTVLKEVIDMNTYSLVSNYKSMFDGTKEESGESIFEIEYQSGNIGEGNYFSSLFTPYLFNMSLFPNNMLGNGYIIPTMDLYNAYEKADLRKAASIGDSIKMTTGEYEKTKYGLKFVDLTVGVQNDGGINFTVLRYADVLLMYAEALNETGKTTDALTNLNIVRTRAGLSSLSGLSKSDFTLALEKERRVEFLDEGQRWFDLIRTGRAKTVLNAYYASKGLSYTVDDRDLLMPIPQTEIDIDPRLTQNEGY